MNSKRTTLLATALVALAVLSMAATAAANVPGRNGRIAFTSGREGANDNLAQIFTLNPSKPNVLGPAISIPTVQNRHASWSPDRTKVVFAAGTPGAPTTEDFDLFVKDMITGQVNALDPNETNSNDHPAWSPDGTKIAYEHQPTAGSADRDIKVKTYPSAAPAVNVTSGEPTEFKAAWTPDSKTLYYAKVRPAQNGQPQNFDIVDKPATAAPSTPAADAQANPMTDDYQPAISPDGTKVCFTLQSTVGNSATAEIYVADFPSFDNGVNYSNDNTKGDINCVFSPDSKRIAYTNGVFSQGRLVTKRIGNPTGTPDPVADDQGSNNFDGNADWAPDGSPDCPDQTVTTRPGQAITISLECTDTGPPYERTDPNGFVDAQPTNGKTSDDSVTTNPSTVKYTPNPGFSGTDRIIYNAFDDFGFGTDKGTVTIRVATPSTAGNGNGGGQGSGGQNARPKCAGRTATIVGTRGPDRLAGTRRRDVIVGGGGNDRIRAGSGNDIVCAGSGNDRVDGGRGNDRISGGAGNDRLNGASGNDRVSGDSGRDRLSGGSGRDRLDGGRSRDRCAGGPGRDRARSCEVSR